MSQNKHAGQPNYRMNTGLGARIGVLIWAVACPFAHAAAPDKSHFTLFNPTPPALMREMSTDRPDTTESPHTVDAGHFQAEMSFIEFTHDGDDDTDEISALPINLKVGLLNNLDLQLVLNPYQNVRASSQRDSGVGSTEVRVKLNLWGNDDGRTAFALMPFVRFPTGPDSLSGDELEGGVIMPLGIGDLPAGFEIVTMLELDAVYNDADGAYGLEVVHTITLGHELFVPELAGYIEYVGIAPSDAGETYLAYLDLGMTYGVNENTQLDAGVNFGLSDQAEDYTLFAGLSFRM